MEEASTKMMVNGDMKRVTAATPSIVARLMGVDTLPPSVLSETSSKDKINQFISSTTTSRKEQLHHFYPKTDKDSDQWSCYNDAAEMRRQHPQEEQLQLFKKEFEAWQASRFNQCSRVAQLVVNIAGHLVVASPTHNSLPPSEQQQDCVSSPTCTTTANFENRCCINDGEMQHPDRIVILKPGPDEHQDCWASSSPAGSSEEMRGSSIDNFLEEVKQRLVSELLEGNTFEAVRQSVAPERNANLVRSESTRSSSRRELQFNGTEFVNPSTRRFLSERLRNMVRKRTSLDDDTKAETSRSALEWGTMQEIEEGDDDDEDHVGICSSKEPSPRNLMRSLSAPVSGTSFGKLLLEDRHVLTGAHIRRKHEVLDTVSEEELRKQKKERFNLKQKVSSFRHNLSLRGRMLRKRFQRVESCNYGKDIHIVNNNTRQQATLMNLVEIQKPMKENWTEVPPSPASISSSCQEDLWRPSDYVSPVSTPNHVGQLEDESGMPQVFRDICSNLKELRKQINRLGSTEVEEAETESPEECCKVDVEHEEEEEEDVSHLIEDKAEALYIRDLLIASGLYDGSSYINDDDEEDMCSSSRWRKPIPKSVFEKVEEGEVGSRKKWDVDRKMLYDLLNEALSSNVGRRRRMVTLRGNKLLERVWKMIQEYVYHPCDSIHNHKHMKMGSITSWSSGLNDMDDEDEELGKQIQFLILEDLIYEIVKEFI
ncbi:hypothetical protein LINPERPRIM_LOCUS306 [Linum perenne]